MILSPNASAPVGIFDSGVGGLTVFRQIRIQMPQESVFYIADTANVPYGDKPLSEVRDLALKLTGRLIDSGAKIVVMASGTSTVAGLSAAQALYPGTPIFGMIEAGARAATEATERPIGVLATNATVQSLAFTQAIRHLYPGRRVVELGCPKFVPLVESGQSDSAEAVAAAQEYCEPLLAEGVGAIILGCTHFPFLLPALRKACREYAAGPPPIFVDPAEETVLEIKRSLAETTRQSSSSHAPELRFAATGDPDDFGYHASRLLGSPISEVSFLSL